MSPRRDGEVPRRGNFRVVADPYNWDWKGTPGMKKYDDMSAWEREHMRWMMSKGDPI